MPELPEVETVRRGMEQSLAGRTVSAVDVRRTGLRVPFPKDLAKTLKGRRIASLRRRAKYILVHFDTGPVMVLHLGMAGRIFITRGNYKPQKHDHFILRFDDGSVLAFNDARRFGMIFLVPENEMENHRTFQNIGPEPLDRTFTGKVLAKKLAGKKTAVKLALLDQRVLAGVGNIYACEALFKAGISPLRPACRVGRADAVKLAAAVKNVLRRAICAGGSTLRDHRRPDGDTGYFQYNFKVYGQGGKPCPVCAGIIKRIAQGGRSSFYCPRCQR